MAGNNHDNLESAGPPLTWAPTDTTAYDSDAAPHERPSGSSSSRPKDERKYSSRSLTTPLTYLMLIGQMGAIAVICTFYALSLNNNKSTDAFLFLLITNVVSILQTCASETLKLYFRNEPSLNRDWIFHLLVTSSLTLTIAAPIINTLAPDGSKRAPICILCATLLMCIHGCLGALDTADRKHQADAIHQADDEKGSASRESENDLRKRLIQKEKDLEAEREKHTDYEEMRKRDVKQRKALRQLKRMCWLLFQRAQSSAGETECLGSKGKKVPGPTDETWSMSSNDLDIMANAYDRKSAVPVEELLFNKLEE